ncbi:cell division protein FtsW [Fusobacterium naviforme]|uniref:Probable peptidoglycan glycosyltransferase FtsW n=1 Tax=Moryella indoligenes TaxID=371674 RepID=A0AAE3V922_9FIRM|nr:FtsW/RodA/SpoVE family cell cycle protein [Moryella indoligenes]KAB0578805.1 FtsW/RodA/SpoVE family cell cycle protein [Fusobacterium naviforme]MDQ0151939.1 cell division protein FtsW [Moryella indoligenes]PSL11578.1 cell division protein FtsW [Fusobacterium naviforme]STO26660.1 Cell division protein FtsW [Fusobacterium naviforme]
MARRTEAGNAGTRSGKSAARPSSRNAGRRTDSPGARAPERHKNFYDYSLVFAVVFLTAFGLLMIYSSSSYMAQINPRTNDAAFYLKRQGMIALGGFVLMVIISLMDYHWILKCSKFAYALSYVLMIAVMIVGKEVNGKKRWLGVGPLSFQPTEFAKLALILFLTVYIVEKGREINRWKGIAMLFALDFPIAALVGKNNLSSGIIILGLGFVMSFVATKRYIVHLLLCALAGLGVAVINPVSHALLAVGLLHPYQLSRILVWQDPARYAQDGGYQVLQGLYAIGSGGLMGKGLGESIQKMGFVPEAQNDMIFSIICEELGLFGAVSLILVFLFMIYRFLVIANSAPDLSGALLVVGIMAHIAIQVILNIAVVTNTIPNTGITLPFISYGGTSVLFLMVEMGLVLSVSHSIRADG